MKDVPAVKWPASPAHVGAFGPLAGRHDQSAGMAPEAVRTPSADEPPQEVESDDVPGEADDQGCVGDS